MTRAVDLSALEIGGDVARAGTPPARFELTRARANPPSDDR